MTVSNVFNGKKVVQQIYLGQTKIWQSLGWETTPTSLLQNWYMDTGQITCIDTDIQGNIYYIIDGYIYKTDAKANKPVLLSGVSLGSTISKLVIDKTDNDTLYAVAASNNLNKYIKDSQGNYSRDSTFTLSGSGGGVYNFCIGIDSFYTIQFNNGYLYIYRYSKSGGNSLGRSNVSYSISPILQSTPTALYVVSPGESFISSYPLNFGAGAYSTNISGLPGAAIRAFGIDSLGYLYTACNDNYIYKYDNQGNQIFKVAVQAGDTVSSSYARFFVFDSKDNFYTGNLSYPKIYEYSSDGTYLASFSTKSGISATPVIDNNDNIYVPQISGGLYQLFNIQKEE